MEAMKKAEEAVEKLYEYRDHYVENFGIEKVIQKTEDVRKEMESTLEVLEGWRDDISNKATYQMLRGKVLNVLPSHDPQAEEALSKAVKLDPKLVEAWNQLGECLWKSGDVPGAKNCFTSGISHSKNKVSLRNLSMVLRQIPGENVKERAEIVEDSVEKAKEAVQLDLKDGSSWVILGNAYLSLFFAAGQNPKSLKQCMSAYAQAEKDTVAKSNPDLHFNRSIAYKYQEEYQLALDGFMMARQLDPTWTDPSLMEKQLLNYLTNVTEFTESKGKMKGKKLQSLVQSLKDSDLGPYAGGSYTSSKKTISLTKCSFSELTIELNSEKVIVGKVVCSLVTDEPVPFTFCMVDNEETCLPVNVYNLAQGCGVKIGDSVAIPEPYLQLVDVKYNDKEFHYKSIRVDSPLVLVVNGKKLGLDKQAPSMLAVSAVCD